MGSYNHAGELIRYVLEAAGVSPDLQHFDLARGDAVKRSELSPELVAWINRRNALDLGLYYAWQDRKFAGVQTLGVNKLSRNDQAWYVLDDIRAGLAKIVA